MTKKRNNFKVNLNVARHKDKISPEMRQNQLKSHRLRRRKKSQKPRNCNNQKYIQSFGIFSEGLTTSKWPIVCSSKASTHGVVQNTNPYFKTAENICEVDDPGEKDIIYELLGKNDNIDSSEHEGECIPIILPLKNNNVGFFDLYKSEKIEEKESEQNGNSSLISRNISESLLNYNQPLSFQNADIYNDYQTCISLLQMPDSVFTKGLEEYEQNMENFDLRQKAEERIATLTIRESGKVQMHIEDMIYTLESIDCEQVREDVMNFSKRNESNSKVNLVNLGNIDEKYVLSLSLKNVLELLKTNKK